MKIQKEKNGITLIALVVTIVVLLILAGISINMTLGNNGIISKAKEARNAMTNATTSDNEFLNSLDDFIDQSFQYGVRIEGDKLMFYGQDGKVYNLQTDYSTDELEVRDGYVYFKEPIQDNSGNTVEILNHGEDWGCARNEGNESSEDFYLIEIGVKHTSAQYTWTYAKYDKEGKYFGEVYRRLYT